MELYRKLKELEEIKWLEKLKRVRLIPSEEGQGREEKMAIKEKRWVKANRDALKSKNSDWRVKVDADENFNMDTNWEGGKLYHGSQRKEVEAADGGDSTTCNWTYQELHDFRVLI